MRRTPIRARRDRPRRMTDRVEHPTMLPSLASLDPELRWAAVRETIYWRSGARCEVCGGLLHGAMEAHHRLSRRYGPDCPCNALALCSRCHHDRVHGEPLDALDYGWSLSRVVPGIIPARVPVLIPRLGRRVFFDCAGDYRLRLTDPDPLGSVAPEHPSREGAPREGSNP